MDRRQPTFVADVMLGRLARWLRVAGWDTVYDRSWSDSRLVRLARAEGRVLLTRDVELSCRPGIVSLLVSSDRLEEQLRQVMGAFELRPFLCTPRCMLCNAPLEEVPRSQVMDLLPPYIYVTQSEFRRCPNCSKLYWPGSHWKRIVALFHRAQVVN